MNEIDWESYTKQALMFSLALYGMQSNLEKEGWIYNAETRCWHNPEHPNRFIVEG